MAKRGSVYRSKARPWLTTEEVMELTGATRRTLLTLEENGVVAPHHFSDRGGVLGWTFAQAQTIRRAQLMRDQGMSFDHIGQLVHEEEFESSSAAFSMEVERDRRRGLKCSLLTERHTADFAECEHRGGPYLRYIPQRWLAVVRCEGTVDPGSDAYISARILLADVAQHIGWCVTDFGGTVRSIDGDEGTFVYAELASQPVVKPVPGMSADGGCYRSFGGACAFDVDDVECALCPRFGAPVSDADRIRWADRISEIGAAPLPPCYDIAPEGPWGDLDSQLNYKSTSVDGIADSAQIVAARPTLMPLAANLPVGITGAVLPASVWLCLRTNAQSIEASSAQLSMLARTMKSTALTTEKAYEICTALESKLRQGGKYWRMTHGDECMGPLTGLPIVADQELLGWCHDIDFAQVPSLTAPTMTGLFPGDERCIISAEMGDTAGGCELQLLVDMSSLPASLAPKKPAGKNLRRALFSLGAKPDIAVAADKAVSETYCRECKTSFTHGADLQVATCSHCGAPKAIGFSRSKKATAFAADAEKELAEGNFEEALRLADCALKRDADFADAYWLRALARHEVSYHPATKDDSKHIRLGAPGNSPLIEDKDFRAAIGKSSTMQWTTYSYLLNNLERARKNALNSKIDSVRVSAR